jgi:predicted HTH domain antitoxin
MKPTSPQLQRHRRERSEAALDIAVAALRRIERLGSAAELARTALARIETLVPEQAQRR